MSCALAAGWSFASFQSVSVVPMIQCRAPRDDEQDALLGPQDQPRAGRQPVARHHEVDALGRADVELAAGVGHRLRVVGPHAGGVDDLLGADLELLAGLQVGDPGAGDPLPLAQEAGYLGPVRRERAERRRRPHHGHGEPGVVHLGVPVLDGAGERVLAQARGLAQRLPAGQVPVVAQPVRGARGIGHRVVERHPGPRVAALPHPVLQRVEERHRLHQVRRDPVEQQAALPQRLPDQAEVEHLQVAEAAVDQLARPA